MDKILVFQHPDFGKILTAVIDGMAWLHAKAVCQALQLNNYGVVLGDMDDNDRRRMFVNYNPDRTEIATFINEAGLFYLIHRGRNPKAKAFRKWVTAEILPTLPLRVDMMAYDPDFELRLMRYFSALQSYITSEDVHQIAGKLHMKERHVAEVLGGFRRDSRVMLALRERALANKRTWTDPYSPEQMDEAVSILKQPRS